MLSRRSRTRLIADAGLKPVCTMTLTICIRDSWIATLIRSSSFGSISFGSGMNISKVVGAPTGADAPPNFNYPIR